MNGWERIGVVLALLFGIPTFMIAYWEHDSANGWILPSAEVKKLEGQEFWSSLYLQAQAEDPERYKGCIQTTVKMAAPTDSYSDHYTITCEKTVAYAVSNSVLWGLLPGFVFWIIGTTMGWVIAGFRK